MCTKFSFNNKMINAPLMQNALGTQDWKDPDEYFLNFLNSNKNISTVDFLHSDQNHCAVHIQSIFLCIPMFKEIYLILSTIKLPYRWVEDLIRLFSIFIFKYVGTSKITRTNGRTEKRHDYVWLTISKISFQNKYVYLSHFIYKFRIRSCMWQNNTHLSNNYVT